VVHDIVSRFPRTCGRGSSAASIVSYLLFITHVDPLRYNLFFERFLNEGRVDPPDIDVDFPWDEREEVLRYVFKTYPGRSAMVADHVTFARRSTLRDPAKAYGLDKEEIDRLMVPLRLGKLDEIPDYLLRAAGRIKGRPHFWAPTPVGS
jgi:error-prone DNA polymerase